MKKFLAAIFGGMLALNFTTTFAEQPMAQEYREILASNNFYVEYDDKNVKRIIVEQDGKRMERTDLGDKYQKMVEIMNPIGAIFARGNKHPDFIYDDGKYFKMVDDEYMIVADENHMRNENLNPAEGWQFVDRALALPDELAIFNWNERHHKVSPAISAPEFIDSGKKIVDGKEYDCDHYESKVMAADGENAATIAFDMCYSNGQLAIAQSAIIANGNEYGVNKLVIKKISREIPKNAIKVNGNTKVYAAGIGDMNDLLEIPVLVGKLKDLQN